MPDTRSCDLEKTTVNRIHASLLAVLLCAPVLAGEPRVEFLDDLYLSSPGTMLGVIQATQRSVGTLMILAHNPGTHSLAVGLARSGDQGPLSEMRMKFPTGAVAGIDFDVDDWSGVDQGGQLIHFIRPRALTD